MRLNFRGPHVDHTAFGGPCRFTCRTYRSTVISKKDGNCKMAATRRRTCLAKLGMPKNVPSTMTRFGRRSRPCACNAARKATTCSNARIGRRAIAPSTARACSRTCLSNAAFFSVRMTATASRARAVCPLWRRHGYEDRSSGKKLRWSRLQNPEDKAAKNDWDSMVGINGIQWDSMGFNGIHDVSTEIGLQAACVNFIGPAKGILIFMRETRTQRRS